jgi:hypothetical protein
MSPIGDTGCLLQPLSRNLESESVRGFARVSLHDAGAGPAKPGIGKPPSRRGLEVEENWIYERSAPVGQGAQYLKSQRCSDYGWGQHRPADLHQLRSHRCGPRVRSLDQDGTPVPPIPLAQKISSHHPKQPVYQTIGLCS